MMPISTVSVGGSEPSSRRTSVSSSASCVASNSSQQFAAAKAVFDGVILPGPVAPSASGALLSPARVRVERYLKGHGPAVVSVQTGMSAKGQVTSEAEDGISPGAGQRWRIYATGTQQPYPTSICAGSRLLRSRTVHFSGQGISFDYPAGWYAHDYGIYSSFSSSVVSLSAQPMQPPCVTRHLPNGSVRTVCHEPVRRLQPDSIVAQWTTEGFPSWSFRDAPGTPITVGGRHGKWLLQTDTSRMPKLGETVQITVVVPMRGNSHSWYQLSALIRGPDASVLEQKVRTMLGTVRWTQ